MSIADNYDQDRENYLNRKEVGKKQRAEGVGHSAYGPNLKRLSIKFPVSKKGQ